MNYVSICSGIEAATVAWHPLGWRPSLFAEIDKFPSRVLAHHYPEVRNVGDFTQITKEQCGAIDVLVGGTPCQDFSVAGLRAGLDGERGHLTIEFAKLAGRLRSKWLVWENVPGVLSVDGGRAFGLFIGLLGQLGYRFAYRILDAQYIGVPQRRRRVFLVGHLGDWRRSAAVLFELQSVSGDTPPRRETREDFTPTISARTTCQAIAFQSSQSGIREVETHATLDSNNGSRRHNGVIQDTALRRLTPRECERLQGFPDDYTLITPKTADGPRYKALGNSMAVPVMRWIGERIAMVDAL